MSYHIHTTEGIILKRTPFGEANVVLHILTLDLGLIIASARSARLSVSKLRPALQEYTLVSLSCVKGKNGWKVTNVVEKGNFYFEYPEYTHRTLAQISSVLLQMITGESPHPEIFQTVKSGFEFMKTISEENRADFEVLMVLRIMRELGYISYGGIASVGEEVFLKDMTEWSQSLLKKVEKNKKTLVGLINKAIKESHL